MSARKVTADHIHSCISEVFYINAGDAVRAQGVPFKSESISELHLVTVCIIILKNGFKVEGVSACVDPSSYDKALGEKFAFENAFEKIWQLEGYLLKEQMYQEQETADMLADLADGDCDGCKI